MSSDRPRGRPPAASRTRPSAAHLGGGVELYVKDTGPGMEGDILARAFDPYFTTKGERETGLGLALVQSIAQRHDGRMTLETAPRRGRQTLPTSGPIAYADARVVEDG